MTDIIYEKIWKDGIEEGVALINEAVTLHEDGTWSSNDNRRKLKPLSKWMEENSFFFDEEIKKFYLENLPEEIKDLLKEAMGHGYHTAKDEAKGIRSAGYMTRFFDKHNIKDGQE